MKKLIFIGVVGLFVLGSCNSKNTGHEGHDHETVTHNHDEHEGHDHEAEGHDHEAEGADHSHEGEWLPVTLCVFFEICVALTV